MICPGCQTEFQPGLYGIGPKQTYCNPRCQMRTNNRRLYERRKQQKLAAIDRRIRQIVRDAVWLFQYEERHGLHKIRPIIAGKSPRSTVKQEGLNDATD